MKIGKTLYVTKRKDWRKWLIKNHKDKKEIWLIYYKKASGKPRIDYNHAVEEALCYGWIDGIVKSIDGEKFAQRFSPRRPTSVLSEMNKERIRRLIKSKKMTKAGLTAVSHAFDPKTDSPEKVKLPYELENALKQNKQTWKNWQGFSESYKRIRVAYVKSQAKHDKKMGERALKNLVKMTSKNKKYGMVR